MAEHEKLVAIMRTEERCYRMPDEGRGGLRVASDAGTKGTMFRLVQCHMEMR